MGMTDQDDITLGEVGRAVKRIESAMVTQAEFQPVARLVYGLSGLLLTGVIIAMIKLLLTH
jgi:hypothetical protein